MGGKIIQLLLWCLTFCTCTRCYSCRGICLCDANWGGEGCDRADCPKDNCYGHGRCNSLGSCDCDAGFSGMYCSDMKMDHCQHDCYGQGKCQEYNISKSANLTVGSCVCTNDFAGHLCSQLVDRKEYVPYIAPSIWAATVLCGIVALFAAYIIKWNADHDAEEEYQKVKHAKPQGIAPKSALEAQENTTNEDEHEHVKLIDSDTEDEEEMNMIVYK